MTPLGITSVPPALVITVVCVVMCVALRWSYEDRGERLLLRIFLLCVAGNAFTAALFYMGVMSDDIREFCAAAVRAAGSIVGLYLSYAWWKARQR
jgi:hypothetical protein